MVDRLNNIKPEKKVENYVWSFQSHLGSGAFGKVYLGKDDKTQEPVAIKVLKLAMLQSDDYLLKSLSNEIEIMKKLSSPYIVKHLNVYFTKHNVYIIQEYCEGGDLRAYMTSRKGPIAEKQAKRILVDIVNGFTELARHEIIHRDLKPENILIKSETFKIGDFGLSRQIEDSNNKALLTTQVGTPLYMAPQVLKHQKYSGKADIWSLGIIYYEILCGKTPWCSRSLYELINVIERQPLRFPFNISMSDLSKDFIRHCLQKEENKRFTWDDVFNHKLVKADLKEDLPKPSSQMTENLDDRARHIIDRLQLSILGILSAGRNLEEYYNGLDKSGDTKLDRKEFEKLIQNIDSKINHHEINHIFSKFDLDNDGFITFVEFKRLILEIDYSSYEVNKDPFLNEKAERILVAIREKVRKNKVDVENLFKNLDKNSDGVLTKSEFEKYLFTIDPELTKREIEYLFVKFDNDKNGVVVFKEFYDNIIKDSNLMNLIQTLDRKAGIIIKDLKEIITKNKLEINKVFRNFEHSKNKMNLGGFTKMMQIVDKNLKDDEIEFLFRKFDVNNDDFIEFKEFENQFK